MCVIVLMDDIGLAYSVAISRLFGLGSTLRAIHGRVLRASSARGLGLAALRPVPSLAGFRIRPSFCGRDPYAHGFILRHGGELVGRRRKGGCFCP